MVEAIDEAALKDGLEELGDLAETEYHQSLAEVASGRDASQSALRVGRLIGVVLKEPFATAYPLQEPSGATVAYRGWELVDEGEFEQHTANWQYEALGKIRDELLSEAPYMDDWSTYQFAFDAHYERGFLAFFGRAVRKYICGDPEIRTKVDEALKEASKGGTNLRSVTPEAIVGTGGLGLGVYLVSAIPFLGFFGAPVIAGLVVILYRLGVEGFCDWSEGLRTDDAEKR